MLTVTQMLSRLGNIMNDPDEEIFTPALKLDALNQAQKELVISLLASGSKGFAENDILGEIQEIETKSVGIGGFPLSGTSVRHFLTNGYVNSSMQDPDGVTQWVERMPTSSIGKTGNPFLIGTTGSPKASLFSGTYRLQIDAPDFPVDVTFYYVGEPYALDTIAGGIGKNKTVTTSDLNPLLHDLIVSKAEVQLRRLRGEQRDMAESGLVFQMVEAQINSLKQGESQETKSRDYVGGFLDKNIEIQEKQIG